LIKNTNNATCLLGELGGVLGQDTLWEKYPGRSEEASFWGIFGKVITMWRSISSASVIMRGLTVE